MSIEGNKPEPFKEGKRQLSASDLNRLRDLIPRQVRAGGNLSVDYYGQDRIGLTFNEQQPQLPGPAAYLKQFIILNLGDSSTDYCLTCTPLIQGSDIAPYVDPDYYQYNPTPPDPDSFIFTPPDPVEWSTSNSAILLVARPYYLQQLPWDGKDIVQDSDTYSISFTGTDARTLTNVSDSSTIDQVITPEYSIGDVITALRARTGYYDQFDNPVVWMDANTAGRTWMSLGSGSPLTITDGTDTDTDASTITLGPTLSLDLGTGGSAGNDTFNVRFHGARYVSGGSTQNIFGNSLTTITIMTSKEIDSDSFYHPSSSYAIPAGFDGYYSLGLSTAWDSVSIQTTFGLLFICNNTAVPENQLWITMPAGSPVATFVSPDNILKFTLGPVLLHATDIITFKCAQEGNSSIMLRNAAMELTFLGFQ